MTDRVVVLMAVAAAGGALAARPVPVVLGLVVAAAAFAIRRPGLLVLGVALLTAGLAARSWAGLVPPRPQRISHVATLLTDPETIGGALRVEVRLGNRHVEAWARGSPAGSLYARLAGERIELTGSMRPVPSAMAGRLARRHISARLTVDGAGRWWPGPWPVRAANALRRTLVRGAVPLPPDHRALFAGFVLGDDRGQSAVITDDFRGSGLSHLLVVSGQNVAFVLALAGPLLRRFGLRLRFALGLVVLLGFGLVTRWEPSVLRAEAMAAIALGAFALGRPASAMRVLALAFTGLLLIDPMLVRSIGFLLSVGACIGIALLARPVAARLPGPRALATAFGVTIGAQVGVAPVLVPVFGPLPVAALPANLLAIPAAGPIMVWGMTGGVIAGLLPAVGALLHLPTRLLISWVALVARVASRLPLGRIGLLQLAAVAALLVGLRLVCAGRFRRAVLAAALIACVVLGPSSIALSRSPPTLIDRRLAPGLRAWRQAGATVLVVEDARPVAALAALRENHIRRADLVVVTSSGRGAVEVAAAILARVTVRAVVGKGALPAVAGEVITVGPWRVTVVTASPRVTVAVCAQHGATVSSCS